MVMSLTRIDPQGEWEFCHKGIEDWTQRLQIILLEQGPWPIEIQTRYKV